jgi:hypothetical protein
MPMKKTRVGWLALLGPIDIIEDASVLGVNVANQGVTLKSATF